MNNLLRTLTSTGTNVNANELKLLLTSVKDGRKNNYESRDSKAGSPLADAFYASLEGVLIELRTITIDNRDAEAFLKPVLKIDVPDYYNVITHPMDMQTMLKKVKAKTYTSKRDFKEDLDLIWNNCRRYNSNESHPLRACAARLERKANKLLQYITDRKDRIDPKLPSGLIAQAVANSNLSAVEERNSMDVDTPKPINPNIGRAIRKTSSPRVMSTKNRPFSDTPAIIRTPDGMAKFIALEASSGAIDTGKKRKALLPSSSSTGDTGTDRPEKRPRLDEDGTESEKWWTDVLSDELIGNGVPVLHTPRQRRLTKQRKPLREVKPEANPKALLDLMNSNIRTMRRIRNTHSRFATLNSRINAKTEGGEEDDQQQPVDNPDDNEGLDVEAALLDDRIDENPWTLERFVVGDGKGIELGQEAADHCLKWVGGKVLEHSGFQGTSTVAMNVLAGITSEYLLNMGRTIKLLSDKYANTMTPEEIILHALFESGTSKVTDLERYISEDVERYGTKLGDLENKLIGAFREATVLETQALDDGDLFGDDEEEDATAFGMGNFTEAIGDDFFGFRELGIAAEFGLTSLSIPKRLLKGRKGAGKGGDRENSHPKEPPLPFPPPPPFVPLNSTSVDRQIGLLKDYYSNRIAAIHATPAPPPPEPAPKPTASSPPLPYLSFSNFKPPALAGPVLNAPQAQQLPQLSLAPPVLTAIPSTPTVPAPMDVSVEPTPTILPDDPPHPTQVKMGPLGQILKVNLGTKKRAPAPGANGAPVVQKKKKKAVSGVGTGNWKRKNQGKSQDGGEGQQQSLSAAGTPAATPAPVFAMS